MPSSPSSSEIIWMQQKSAACKFCGSSELEMLRYNIIDGGIVCVDCTEDDVFMLGHDAYLPLVGPVVLNVWHLGIDVNVWHIATDLFALPQRYFENSAENHDLVDELENCFGRDLAELIFGYCDFEGEFELFEILGYYEI